jgi:VIT1/CCC1 family predicted Fe2+/Mn2+ transporter
MNVSKQTMELLLRYQKNEITEHHVYRWLAAHTKSPENRTVLEGIANDELRHYNQWKDYTQRDVGPAWWRVSCYCLVGRVLGLTFGVKLMERGEEGAQATYGRLAAEIPLAESIADDEHKHEDALLALLDEERLRYTGSMVLGLNDALVELTGALAGFTFALQNTKLVALTGSITGFAAALSMAASEYLSTKAEETGKNPLKASLYTGTAYVLTVVLLILPYLLLDNHYVCLGATLVLAILTIAVFNFYISVAKDQCFRSRFLEMALLSLGVASLSFVVGYLLRTFIGVDV